MDISRNQNKNTDFFYDFSLSVVKAACLESMKKYEKWVKLCVKIPT